MIPTLHMPTPQGLALSADEARLLAAYRCMDQRRKQENLDLLEQDANQHPKIKRPAASSSIRMAAIAGKRVAA